MWVDIRLKRGRFGFVEQVCEKAQGHGVARDSLVSVFSRESIVHQMED